MNRYQEALDRIGRNYYLSQESGNFEHFENLYLENKKTLQELVDKATPIKPLHIHALNQYGVCPKCNSSLGINSHSKYCGKCGQAIDWTSDKQIIIDWGNHD